MDGLERQTHDLHAYEGYLKLVLKLDQPRPGLKDRIKKDFDNVLSVEVSLPDAEITEEETEVDLAQLSLLEAYSRFYREKRAQDLPAEVEAAFKDLLEDDEPEPVLSPVLSAEVGV